jgi:ATP-dependent Clp protease ATP-binding subunit ClpA
MFERFTTEAQQVIAHAGQEALELRHQHLGTEHILLGLLWTDVCISRQVLTTAGIDGPGVRADVQRLLTAPGIVLNAADAAALQTVGIDLAAVQSSIETSFGPDAMRTAGLPPPRQGLLRRRRPHRGTAFTLRAKKVLELALSEADQLGTHHIGSGHILLGVLSEDSGLAATILLATGHSLDDLRRDTLTALDKAA